MFDSNADTMNAEWKSQFEQSNKRDDLADCFLQVLAHLAKHNQISYADNLKINIV
jgi:NTP pyrophosphatase (non-canonical NTP hydrolase)